MDQESGSGEIQVLSMGGLIPTESQNMVYQDTYCATMDESALPEVA